VYVVAEELERSTKPPSTTMLCFCGCYGRDGERRMTLAHGMSEGRDGSRWNKPRITPALPVRRRSAWGLGLVWSGQRRLAGARPIIEVSLAGFRRMEQNSEVGRVCPKCRVALTFSPAHFLDGSDDHWSDYLHQDLYPRMPGLVQSIPLTGCQFCSFLLAALRSRNSNAADFRLGSGGTGEEGCHQGNLILPLSTAGGLIRTAFNER
jgi:hypothetical protein